MKTFIITIKYVTYTIGRLVLKKFFFTETPGGQVEPQWSTDHFMEELFFQYCQQMRPPCPDMIFFIGAVDTNDLRIFSTTVFSWIHYKIARLSYAQAVIFRTI